MLDRGPVDAGGRIAELDVIRGFALFGVLWMNLIGHSDFAYPATEAIEIAPAPVESVLSFLGTWLMIGKAQALFSMLFGFGFALFLSRAEAAGRNGTSLYLRRLGFLLVLGFAHALLVWFGDILQTYAIAGVLLIFTRRWPAWLLLAVGLPLVLFSPIADRLVWEYVIGTPGTPAPWLALMEEGAIRRMPIFLAHDYIAYVRENTRALFGELYGNSSGVSYLAWVFGRFLLGAWLFRMGWVQDSARHAAAFRRWAVILIVAGLALSLIQPLVGMLGLRPEGEWQRLPLGLSWRAGQLVLPLGYAAGLVVLCASLRWRRRLSGLGAVGRMALTNYLAQSLLYVLLLYGFGAGLLLYTAPVFSLVVALLFFAVQIAVSRWWLARHTFGPAEWLWRSWTYGRRQPMRRNPLTAVSVSG